MLLLRLNRPVNRIRAAFDLPYWSLLATLKMKAKKAVQVIGDFEAAVVEAARRAEADGVVCGHIHCAEDRMIGGVRYLNCGDWVESCTALVEHLDGRLELLRWRISPVTPGVDDAPDADSLSGDGAATPGVALRLVAGVDARPRPTARSVMRGSRDGWMEGARDDISTRHPTRMRVLFLVQGEGRGT